MNKKGFTLIELLAVIVILAVIVTISISSVFPLVERGKMDALGSEITVFKDVVDTVIGSENIKGEGSKYAGRKVICFDLEYLHHNGYTKGSGDGYFGSVLAVPSTGIWYNYYVWFTNGEYAFLGVKPDHATHLNAVKYEPEFAGIIRTCSDRLNTTVVDVDNKKINTVSDVTYEELTNHSEVLYVDYK